eukprot:3657834-Prymnesium_polylepis.5
MSTLSLSECLKILGLAAAELERCSAAGEDAKRLVKRAYLRQSLALHPDRPGCKDPTGGAFREANAAYERLLGADGLLSVAGGSGASGPKSGPRFFTTDSVVQKAVDSAAACVPYKVTQATTANGKCGGCGEPISLGSLKVGSLDPTSGTFGRWKGLACCCWKVPARFRIMLQELTDGVCGLTLDDNLALLLTDELSSMTINVIAGIGTLDTASKVEFGRYTLNQTNWARRTIESTVGAASESASTSMSRDPFEAAKPPPKRRKPHAIVAAGAKKKQTVVPTAEPAATSDAIVEASTPAVELPTPGKDGVEEGQLKSTVCVLTGIFYGLGGVGLSEGKDAVKSFITSHGGR